MTCFNNFYFFESQMVKWLKTLFNMCFRNVELALIKCWLFLSY
jgi:hypothetical protein